MRQSLRPPPRSRRVGANRGRPRWSARSENRRGRAGRHRSRKGSLSWRNDSFDTNGRSSLATIGAMTTAASAGIDPRRYLGLVLLGAAMGIPAALVAAVFLSTIHVIEGWLWQDLPTALGASSPPPYLVIGLPAVGGAVVALARRLLPGDGGHSPLEGIGAGVTPLRYAP